MINKKYKLLLIELSDNTCEQCHEKKEISELEIHRIRRGCSGGTYHFRNCMVLCKACHRKFHSGEFL